MRVGVDATSWTNRRGFGRFARNAVGRLVELDGDSSYVFFADRQGAEGAGLPARAELRLVGAGGSRSLAASSGSTRALRDLLRLTAAVEMARLDAFLFPSLYTYFPLVRTPSVVGVHDTILDELPELTVPARRERLAAALKHRVAMRRARCLFTVSEASRAAIAERFGIAPERLRVVPEAPDPVFSPRRGEALAAGLESIGLVPGEPYFVYAGGVSPHKNLETLIDAFALLRHATPAPRFVLVGELETELYLSSAAAVRERIASHGLADAVLLPGFVSDETLACLYSGATAFVTASLAEGFGLPVVEAAACGAAVVASDLPAHRETLGEAALLVPPRSTEALAEALGRLASDEPLRRERGASAAVAVSRLSWDAAAIALRSLLAEAARIA